MKTIKTYKCECGEDFYEDDVNCVNCRKLIDKTKLKNEEVADIKYTKYEKLRRGYEEVQRLTL
jgi:isopentenyldiphosphate isomerase